MTADFLMPERKPHVMLTFLEVVRASSRSGAALDRLKQHVYRKLGKDPKTKTHVAKKRNAPKRKPVRVPTKKVGIIY